MQQKIFRHDCQIKVMRSQCNAGLVIYLVSHWSCTSCYVCSNYLVLFFCFYVGTKGTSSERMVSIWFWKTASGLNQIPVPLHQFDECEL